MCFARTIRNSGALVKTDLSGFKTVGNKGGGVKSHIARKFQEVQNFPRKRCIVNHFSELSFVTQRLYMIIVYTDVQKYCYFLHEL